MKRFTKEVRGSISLFLSMIILLLVVLEGFLIDGSKVLAAKMYLSSAGEMSLNAGLTEYDEALRDIYGLFATCRTEEELTANLKVYFQKTLGEATGAGGEENGEYVDQLLSYVDTAIRNGWNGEEAGRLLNLTLETGSFHAGGVAGSALSEPCVLKNQILEYMKYRGPASLGYGMIEKIYAFKDLNKQQKTLEAKLNYEETMSEVQEACEKAYTSIEAYNQLLEGSLKPETVESLSYEINRAMFEAIIATWCYSAAKRDPEIENNWQRNNGQTIKGSDSVPNVWAAKNACRLMESMSALYTQVADGLQSDFNEHPRAAMRAIRIILGYREEYGNYCNLFTTWKSYMEYYTRRMAELEKLLNESGDDEEEDGDEDILKEIKELEEQKEEYEGIYLACEKAINQFREVLNPVRVVLEADIDERMRTATSKLNQIAGDAETLGQLGRSGKEDLDDVLSAMGNLEAKGQAWQSSINNLSAGEVKTSMQSDYNNKSEMLDRGKIIVLREKLANGISYAEILENAAKATAAVDYPLFQAEGKGTYSPYMRSRFDSGIYQGETLPYNGTSYSGFSEAAWVENANQTNALSDPACTVYFNSPNGGKKEGRITKMDLSVYTAQMDSISGRTDEFFLYLERICPKSEAEKQSAAQAKEEKKKLFEQAKSVSLSPDEPLPSLSSSGSGTGAPGYRETDPGADDKAVSRNAKNNTKGSSDFLSDIGSLLTKGRDKLYLSEYATQMFSYYTVDKPQNENESAPVMRETLSGYPLTADNNAMYKAEVEYILWGNPSGSEDVKYTLTTIFGIRFLLNSIYAFTGDPEIRQVSLALATSIAGWTGFGVPLVQSVLIIGFALAETSLDIRALADGKSVPIYKSTSSWQIKPRALGKEIIGQTINDAAKNYLYEKLNGLTDATKETFRKQLNDFSDETVDNLVSTASAAILTPVQERLIGLINVVAPDREKINYDIRETLNDLKAIIASEPDSIAKQLKLAAAEGFDGVLMNKIVSSIQAVQNNRDLDNQEITEKISAALEDCRKSLEQSLKIKAKQLVDAECRLVEDALDSGNEALQEKTSEAFDRMLMRIDCGVSFADLSSVQVDGGKGRTAGAAALTMHYREYLWLFIAVKSIQSEEDMLRRIGTLIEANLASSNTAPSRSFKLNNAYTFIELDAKADLSTTFFSMPVPVSGGGSVTLGQDQYTIGYRGVLGY